jgi:proteasome activator subunit 4
MSADVDSRTPVVNGIPESQSIIIQEHLVDGGDHDQQFSKDEEDALLREATGGFPDWIASFIRRVIVLFDNLPEESGGDTEGNLNAI